jgi:hypothetical protein
MDPVSSLKPKEGSGAITGKVLTTSHGEVCGLRIVKLILISSICEAAEDLATGYQETSQDDARGEARAGLLSRLYCRIKLTWRQGNTETILKM